MIENVAYAMGGFLLAVAIGTTIGHLEARLANPRSSAPPPSAGLRVFAEYTTQQTIATLTNNFLVLHKVAHFEASRREDAEAVARQLANVLESPVENLAARKAALAEYHSFLSKLTEPSGG